MVKFYFEQLPADEAAGLLMIYHHLPPAGQRQLEARYTFQRALVEAYLTRPARVRRALARAWAWARELPSEIAGHFTWSQVIYDPSGRARLVRRFSLLLPFER